MSRIRALLCASAALAVTACTVGPAKNVPTPGSSPANTSAPGDASTFGYGPTRVAGVKYQPDVVIVGGGAASVRWASSDGLTWAIDRHAPHAGDLRVHSVMFVTSRAVGRVVEIHDEGDVRVVTLAPIDLTDVLSDADLRFDQGIDLTSMRYQDIPDAPGAVPDSLDSVTPVASAAPAMFNVPDDVVTLPGLHFSAAPAKFVSAASPAGPTVKRLPPATQLCHSATIKTWTVNPCIQPPDSIVVEVDTKTRVGLKFGGSITLHVNALRTQSHVVVHKGLMGSTDVRLEGIQGVDVAVSAGASGGALDNAKVKLEFPIEVEYPMPPSPATFGLPLNFAVEFKMVIETAIGGNNSTVAANGSYRIDGPIGVVAGKVVSPKVTVVHSLLDSLRGVTLAPSGVVFAMKFKMQFGLGMPGLIAGPYVTATFSVGVTKGSMLGSPLATCLGSTFGVWVGAGAGLTIDLEKYHIFLPEVVKEIKVEDDKSWNVYTVSQTMPDVPLCKAST